MKPIYDDNDDDFRDEENEYTPKISRDPFDIFLGKICTSTAEYLMMRRRLLNGEAQLEYLIANELIDVLVDTKGNFTYRITEKGMTIFKEKIGIVPSRADITFLEFIGM